MPLNQLEDRLTTRPSNMLVDVVSYGRDQLALAMRLALGETGNATHYRVLLVADSEGIPRRGESGLVLLWANSRDARELPYPMGHEDLVNLAWGWLANAARYPDEPNGDGSFIKGFNVDTRVAADGWDRGLLTVRPAWAHFGK